jgi:L,D-transpeptidase YcbB
VTGRTYSQRSGILSIALSFTILLGACRHSSQTPEAPQLSAAQAGIRSLIESTTRPAYVAADDRGTHVWQETQRFYKQNGYAAMWSDGRRLRPQAGALVRALRAATREGLDPADYGVDELSALHQTFAAERAADLDVRSTYAYLAYAADISHGTVDPEDIDPHWHAAARDVDLHGTLTNALDQNRIEQSLLELAPRSPQYVGLKHQLAKYLDAPQGSAPIQLANGDGKPLSMTAADVVNLIAINMDRWRWLPDDLGARYLMVNVPAFRLDAIEQGKSVLEMKVVTGTKENATPVLSDRMTTIVFSPYWNIPRDIVEKEIAPNVEQDPEYLERHNMEVDDAGRYRQRPGKGNSLGLVKFVFPNHYNVYLHDTPAPNLFTRIERDFSHGCVRLERPLDLAMYLLRDQPEWTRERMTAAMNSGTEQSVTLKEPFPIYLVYFTAWEESGQLQVRPDVYGHDHRYRNAVDQ